VISRPRLDLSSIHRDIMRTAAVVLAALGTQAAMAASLKPRASSLPAVTVQGNGKPEQTRPHPATEGTSC